MKKALLIILIAVTIGFIAWWFLAPIDYYEYEANSRDECLPGERYNKEFGVCYFDFYCENEIECEEVDKEYSKVLSTLASEYETHSHHKDIIEDQLLEEEGEETVVQGQKAEVVALSQTEKVEKLMQTLLPKNEQEKIEKIISDSDGPDEGLAYVEPANTNGSLWVLAYDPVDTFSKSGEYKNGEEFVSTLIHEYAHVLSLHADQVEHVSEDAEYIECFEEQVILDEGCAKEDSYITHFINTFWSEEDRERVYQAESQNEEISKELFDENPDWYITEYAATNAAEDFAESFTFFVLEENKKPITKADKKISFFYQYPDLVTLRAYMRTGVAAIWETQS